MVTKKNVLVSILYGSTIIYVYFISFFAVATYYQILLILFFQIKGNNLQIFIFELKINLVSYFVLFCFVPFLSFALLLFICLKQSPKTNNREF